MGEILESNRSVLIDGVFNLQYFVPLKCRLGESD